MKIYEAKHIRNVAFRHRGSGKTADRGHSIFQRVGY